jgi:hypothetical protein
VTRKTLTWGHVAFDTSGLFTSRKIDVCLDSPYLQQVASIRKMPTYLGIRICHRMPHEHPAVQKSQLDLNLDLHVDLHTVGVGALPIIKKNYLSAGPETRRKRSVCSRASKCTIERVPYLNFDKVMGI